MVNEIGFVFFGVYLKFNKIEINCIGMMINCIKMKVLIYRFWSEGYVKILVGRGLI